MPSRTVADCIHLTGVSFGSSILRKDQLALLDTASPFFFLVGPPGSGKTLLLALKAAEWAKQGDHVVVVSMAGVRTGTLVSWTLYDRVVEAVEDFRVKQMKKTLAISAEGDETNVQRKKSSKGQSKWRKEQMKSSVCKGQTKSSVCKPHDVDNTESEKAQGTPTEFESPPTGFTSSATSISLQNSSPRTGESRRAANRTPVSEHSNQYENIRPLVDNPSDSNVTASNVHQAFISAETDVDKLVMDVLAKYDDTPVRFIVDECLRQCTEDYVFGLFSKAQVSLDRMKSVYCDIVERVAGGSGAAGHVPSRADAWRERQERASALVPERRASPHRAEEDTSIVPETGSCLDKIPGQNDQSRLASEDSSRQRLNPKDSEKKSPASDATGEGLNPKHYFLTMDDRMDKLTARFQQLHAASPGGPRLLHSARWHHDVDQLSRTFQSVQTLKTQALTLIESATSHEDLTG